MRQVHHQNLPELFEVIDTPEFVYLVTDLCRGGSVGSLLSEGFRPSEQICRRIFRGTILALGHLHTELDVCHGGIHAENVLIDEYDCVRLTDFGLTTVFPPTADRPPSSPLNYNAPELFHLEGYSKASDVWSCGVLLYLMAAGRFPFAHRSLPRLVQGILREPISFPDELSPSLCDLLRSLLQKDPSKRPAVADILAHPWVCNGRILRELPFRSKLPEIGIDETLLSELEGRGIDGERLRVALARDEFSSETAVYRIKKRAKAVTHVKKRQAMAHTGNPLHEGQPQSLPTLILGRTVLRTKFRGSANAISSRRKSSS
jgi:serine/threonine protein kinase